MAVKSICGVIILNSDPKSLVGFYEKTLGLKFEEESHDDLVLHYGTDIGTVHFAIHPPENFDNKIAGGGSAVIAFDVDSIEEMDSLALSNGARCIQPVHDEGFGKVARYLDPAGNPFELVELTYVFSETKS